MSPLRNLAAATCIALTAGCANGPNSVQESELAGLRANNLAVQEKNPGLAAALGLLPGGGSFYGRSYGLGVVNLLFWPISILWDPVSGYNAAESINYHASKSRVASLKKRDIEALDTQLASDQISMKQYSLERSKISQKYTYDF